MPVHPYIWQSGDNNKKGPGLISSRIVICAPAVASFSRVGLRALITKPPEARGCCLRWLHRRNTAYVDFTPTLNTRILCFLSTSWCRPRNDSTNPAPEASFSQVLLFGKSGSTVHLSPREARYARHVSKRIALRYRRAVWRDSARCPGLAVPENESTLATEIPSMMPSNMLSAFQSTVDQSSTRTGRMQGASRWKPEHSSARK